jgi:hypothetical protein
MIKFHGRGPQGDLYGFGLSAGNVEYLKQGKPIVIDMREMGVSNMTIVLLYGETEETIAEELKKYGALPESFNPFQPGPGETQVFRDLSKSGRGGSEA